MSENEARHKLIVALAQAEAAEGIYDAMPAAAASPQPCEDLPHLTEYERSIANRWAQPLLIGNATEQCDRSNVEFLLRVVSSARSQREALAGFIRQIFGPKYDHEITRLLQGATAVATPQAENK